MSLMYMLDDKNNDDKNNDDRNNDDEKPAQEWDLRHLPVWKCESVKVNLWKCESESVKVKVWKCESESVKEKHRLKNGISVICQTFGFLRCDPLQDPQTKPLKFIQIIPNPSTPS